MALIQNDKFSYCLLIINNNKNSGFKEEEGETKRI